MAVSVKLRCSECSTIRDAQLTREQKELSCPVCGRRIANLSEGELSEMEAVQKSQLILNLVAIVLFLGAVGCLVMWAGAGSGWTSAKDQPPANQGFFIGAIVCMLISLITGVMGSLKRFVVEF